MHAFKIISYIKNSNGLEHALPAKANNHVLQKFVTYSSMNQNFIYVRENNTTINPNSVQGAFWFDEIDEKEKILNLFINDVLQDMDSYKIGYHNCNKTDCDIDDPCKDWNKIKEVGEMPHTIQL